MSIYIKFFEMFYYKNVNIRLNYKKIITIFLHKKLFTFYMKNQETANILY